MKVAIRNLQKKIPINPARIKKALLNALSHEARKLSGELTVSFVNKHQIKKLNLRYLGRNEPTDVIAFDLSEPLAEGIFADIVVSTDAALRNSSLFKTTPLYEAYLYTIHGLLHLLGYDDKRPKDRQLMQKKAIKILSRLEIK